MECELPITLPINWLGEIPAEHYLTTTAVSTQLLGQLRPEFGCGRDSVLTAIGLHRDLELARLRAWGLTLRCLSAGPTSPDSPACRHRRHNRGRWHNRSTRKFACWQLPVADRYLLTISVQLGCATGQSNVPPCTSRARGCTAGFQLSFWTPCIEYT